MSHPTPTVAIVRSSNRRGAISQALALLNHSLPAPLPSEVTILPDFTSAHCPWAWTHPDAISATLDVVLARGAGQALILDASGSVFSQARLGQETLGRPVRYQAVDRSEPGGWTSVTLDLGIGQPLTIRISSTALESSAVVAITTMKTDGQSSVALTLNHLLNLVHPADRIRLDPRFRPTRGNRSIADLAILSAQRLKGRVTRLGRLILPRRHHETDERLTRVITALAARIRPVISVVDGMVAMEREGPHHGESKALNVVVAGTNAVATDAVAARLMGFDPAASRHLGRAQAERLGPIDLDAIHLVGDPLTSGRLRCVPHSNESNHWAAHPVGRPSLGSQPESLPAPHTRPARTRSRTHR